ncbi:MAG: AbrB/MazE/SpoVT family DNA-binding domain-containing protein [Bacteroidales bacterium]|nr:AbrB/MazE/SpoVT family DNA-binding domain-containing protein [Bacteroidales bacterium]
MNPVIHSKIGQGRRVAIPAELCQQFGMEPGTPVVLEAIETGIVVRPLATVIHEVQDFFRAAIPQDVVLSDVVIRDRVAEAVQEDRD